MAVTASGSGVAERHPRSTKLSTAHVHRQRVIARYPTNTEAAVAADTVIALIDAGWILPTVSPTEIGARLGLEAGELVDSLSRFRARQRVPRTLSRLPFRYTVDDNDDAGVPESPDPEPGAAAAAAGAKGQRRSVMPPAPVGKLRPAPGPKRRGKGGTPEREHRVDEATGLVWMRCSCQAGCGPTGDSWWPQTSFLPRADRPGRFTSQSAACRQRYQAARHLKVAVADDLAKLGIAFTVQPDDLTVGLICAGCGRPLAPGDKVAGTAVLRHPDCG